MAFWLVLNTNMSIVAVIVPILLVLVRCMKLNCSCKFDVLFFRNGLLISCQRRSVRIFIISYPRGVRHVKYESFVGITRFTLGGEKVKQILIQTLKFSGFLRFS